MDANFEQLTGSDGRHWCEVGWGRTKKTVEIEPGVDTWLLGDRIVTVARIIPTGRLAHWLYRLRHPNDLKRAAEADPGRRRRSTRMREHWYDHEGTWLALYCIAVLIVGHFAKWW